MMRHVLILAVTVLAIAAPGRLAAQDSGPLAPRIELEGRTVDVRLIITGHGVTPGYDDGTFRKAEALVDPKTWITARSALYRAHIADPKGWRWGNVRLSIDASGKVSGCQAPSFGKLPIAQAALCKEFSQQRFLPAMTREGERVAGEYSLYFSAFETRVEPGDARRPLVLPDPPPPMVVAAPEMRPQLRTTQFPPYYSWLRIFYREPDSWEVMPRRGADTLGPTTLAAGIILSSDGTTLSCSVAKNSGVPELDQDACEYAKTALKPVWSDAARNNPRAIPLVVTRDGDTLAVYAPIENPRRRAEFADGAEGALVEGLTNAGIFATGIAESPLELRIRVHADGSVRSCHIDQSTGYDALDLDTCRIAENVVRFRPEQDMFGRPDEGGTVFWSAARSAKENEQ